MNDKPEKNGKRSTSSNKKTKITTINISSEETKKKIIDRINAEIKKLNNCDVNFIKTPTDIPLPSITFWVNSENADW